MEILFIEPLVLSTEHLKMSNHTKFGQETEGDDLVCKSSLESVFSNGVKNTCPDQCCSVGQTSPCKSKDCQFDSQPQQCLGCGYHLFRALLRGNQLMCLSHIAVSLSLSFSLCLKINK